MTIKTVNRRIKDALMELRYRPVKVFVFHQVSDVLDPDGMWECDWTQTDVFKRNIEVLKKKYDFISLEEAYKHIANDKFRFKSYAALTADDGWASLQNILPWLAEQQVPVTLFLNPLYLDGKHFQERVTEKLLTHDEVVALVNEYKPYVTIASHGWKHDKCEAMTETEFAENVQKAESVLNEMPGKVPFYAFTYGQYSCSQIRWLKAHALVPVALESKNNLHDTLVDRECIDGQKLTD